ncbi:TonB-dependent receptor [Marinilongibacter aquaticus]|uniref:SusC/RagA family TonB-linked outer membrane protein n=1 Tax=Marinilongibacter aquaticus TaxID=2975157 RepID=UPI0021BDEBBD|nr:TonB-dependent receptor [Marinilongibacter aquaticus]UBM58707.1 TonB-dependent receptor [Marinilongibacter aquaticus]
MRLSLPENSKRYGLQILCVLLALIALPTLAATRASTQKNSLSRKAVLDVELTGRVTDENNEGIPGASVIIKGTNLGTVTDINGNFSIQATGTEVVLIISYIGYLSQEVAVSGRNEIDVQLSPSNEQLSEVVVVGYGTQKKKDLTGAVGTIQSKDIVRANPVQAANALQGQVAGVNITRVNGRPGSGFDITIRGVSNFDSDLNSPLVVIDGVMGGNINSLNPADIASMDVLKDASSTAIYGSRGANGVILITTYKGNTGKPKVSYNSYVGSKRPAHVPAMMSAQQFYQAYQVTKLEDAAALGINIPKPRGWTESELANIENGRSVNWIDQVTDPAIQTSHTVSVTGGNDNTTYNFSGGYLKEGGVTIGTNFSRYSLNAGLESKIMEKVKVGFTSYATYSETNLPTSEVMRSAFRARPTGTLLYDDLAEADKSNDIELKGKAFYMGIKDNQVINPLTELDRDNARHQIQENSILANGFIEYAPVKGLAIRSSISASSNNKRDGEYWGNYTKSQKGTNGNKAQYATNNALSYTWDNIITYDLDTGPHALKITGLQSVFRQNEDNSFTAAEKLPYRSLWHNLGTGSITAYRTGLTQKSLLSFMGRINYSFQDKYLLTITGRSDGASQLSPGNKWIFYPSAALAWRLSDEAFINNINWISNLKLRLSYGIVGNASSVRPYETQATISQTYYDFDGATANGFAINSLANKSLVYEKSKELNFGLNFGFFKNRISGEIEVYDRKTVDLIIGDKLPNSTGFSDVVANVGEIQNKGIELTLNTVNVHKRNFRWTSTLTLTKNKDRVTKLAGGITEDIGNLRFVGQSVFPIYSWVFDGIWQMDEAEKALTYGYYPGNVKIKDLDNDGAITDKDRTIVGKQTPDILLGFRNKLYYKNIDFSFFLYSRRGLMYSNNYLNGTFGEVHSDRYNSSAELDIWTSTNPSNTYFGLNGPGAGNTRQAISNQKADFVRLSDVTLGYTLPSGLMDKIKFSNFRIYGQVSNPLVITDFINFNPEYNSNTANDDVSSMTILIGLNVSF